MTPFEIALTIRNEHDQAKETLEAFVRRTMSQERVSDLGSALQIMLGWDRAIEEISELLDLLRPVERKGAGHTIRALIERKRQLGYDAKFETLCARLWLCPHCQRTTTIEGIELPIGDPDRMPRCTACGGEGIAPTDGKPNLKVRDGGKTGLRPL